MVPPGSTPVPPRWPLVLQESILVRSFHSGSSDSTQVLIESALVPQEPILMSVKIISEVTSMEQLRAVRKIIEEPLNLPSLDYVHFVIL